MIAVISDIHFPSDAQRQECLKRGLEKLCGLDALLVCGDFTDNRGDTRPGEAMKLPAYLQELPYPIGFIDGNHEDYRVLEGLAETSVWDGPAGKAAEHVYYLKRGCCYRIDELRILTIGGSTSGPGYKKNHPDIWQEEEELNEQDRSRIQETLQQGADFDVVLTHTLPERRMEAWFPEKDCSQTNRILEEAAQKMTYGQWCFGHFHQDQDYPDRFHCLYQDVILMDKAADGTVSWRRQPLTEMN